MYGQIHSTTEGGGAVNLADNWVTRVMSLTFLNKYDFLRIGIVMQLKPATVGIFNNLIKELHLLL